MEGFRENFFGRSPTPASDLDGDDEFIDDFPVIVSQGERRLQVRAYCHWTSLLGARMLPLIADLKLDQLADFAPYVALFDFAHGVDDPRITYVGETLAQVSGVAREIAYVEDIPPHTLLSRLTGHYDELLATQAPIAFEDEFSNQHGATILYRGMLLPFAEMDGGPIRHVLGVINWKELADAALCADLAREVSDAMARLAPQTPQPAPAPWSEWADGPTARDTRDEVVSTLGALEFAEVPADIAARMSLTDWLGSARELAQTARLSGERSRKALYAAIGRAYDFALAAHGQPQALAAILADAGLSPQPRAPLLPLAKLVFGADYDKTRLTEYATALAHAQRLGLGRGTLAAHLARVAGGLKGVLNEERRLRLSDTTPEEAHADPLYQRLASLPARPLHAVNPIGADYALLVVRRTENGVVLLGEIEHDSALLARAALHLGA
jgi:hypothetical protein